MKQLATLLTWLLVAGSLTAEEGMWPFNHLPFDRLKKEYRFDVSNGFLDKLQKASVRFNNGGSGSFASPHGLIVTNHHVAADCIKKLSSKKKDYIQDGFYAARASTELKCPDLELNVLLEIETITDKMNHNVRPGMSAKEKFEARRATKAEIERDCHDSTLLRCDVVDLYEGGIFDLYKYKRYTDVRLVFAPERHAAFFGGDIDNFTYPRYCIDVAFLRVYEDGKRISSQAYLPWSKNGAAMGQRVFVSGHPGNTKRLLTLSQVRFEQARRMPLILDWLTGMSRALQAYQHSGGDAERLARDELFGINNSIKAYQGMLAGLRDPELMRRKEEQQKALRESIESDPEKNKKYKGAWEAIAEAQKVKNLIYEEYRLLEGLGFYSRLFTIARHLHRLSEELPKPNTKRLPEYQEANLDSLYQRVFSPAPIYESVEIVKLAQSLRFMRDTLGPQHPVVTEVLGDNLPDVAAKKVIEGTKLHDVDLRKELAADQAREAAESKDPMIRLAGAVDEEARRLRKRFEDEVEAVENEHQARLARARFDVYGTDVYPDATFTLRLSLGVVRGYREDSRFVQPFTTFEGLYDTVTGENPYILPERFTKRKHHVDLETPYNLVSTNDIVGGNSGSPLANSDAEIVGLIFDGNIHSLPNTFLYSEEQARAISVDSRGIVEVLQNIYRAARVVRELTSAQGKKSD